jgi:hypothetical protein
MNWEKILEIAVTALVTVLSCGGFWTYIQSRKDKKSAKTQMILGLGHDRVIMQGTVYIKRGWITPDEYENLHDYLYIPYQKMGGNGTAKKIMEEVKKLPIRPNQYN